VGLCAPRSLSRVLGGPIIRASAPGMRPAEMATEPRPSSGKKGWTRGAAWVVLLAFVLSGRAMWSSWYPLPCMPALWLEYRVTEGIGFYTWRHSEAGPILSGPSGGILHSWFGPWERGLTALAVFVAVSSAGAFIVSGLRNEVGVSAGFGLVFFASSAVFFWARQAAVKQALEGDTGRPTSGCS